MAKVFAAALAIVLSAAVSVEAELKVVAQTSTKAASSPLPTTPIAIHSTYGEMMLLLVAGNGPVETTSIIGDKGARIEYAQATLNLAAGSVALVQPNGDIAILMPKDRVYWRMTTKEMGEMWAQLGIVPKISHKRTGEFMTIAGVRAERISFDWAMEFPLPPEVMAELKGAPTAMTMSGDLWVAADRYKSYASMAVRSNTTLASLGMIKLLEEGIVLRSVLRSSAFRGQEIETIVTSMTEEPAPANAFSIPAGYKLVPRPSGL